MEEDLRNRIRELLSAKGVAYTKITGSGNALQSKFTRQLNGAAITYDVLITLLNYFPDVDANWLLKGEGQMLKSASLPVHSERPYPTRVAENTDSLPGQNTESMDMLKQQMAINARLLAMLEEKLK